jgi:hypothetical protein
LCPGVDREGASSAASFRGCALGTLFYVTSCSERCFGIGSCRSRNPWKDAVMNANRQREVYVARGVGGAKP